VSINKLIVFGAAVILASLIGSTPAAAANPACDPVLLPTDDCDGDGIQNQFDTCDNLDPALDCDGDGVLNGVDVCPDTVVGTDLVVGACTIPGLDFVFTEGPDAGCSLTQLLDECEVAATNHGRYVSCVAHLTNRLKKAGDISGKEKGKIQSCAARSDIGKPSHP
jgi:hypothetical protein